MNDSILATILMLQLDCFLDEKELRKRLIGIIKIELFEVNSTHRVGTAHTRHTSTYNTAHTISLVYLMAFAHILLMLCNRTLTLYDISYINFCFSASCLPKIVSNIIDSNTCLNSATARLHVCFSQ